MSAARLRVYQHLQLAAHRVQKVADRALLEVAGVTTAQAAVLVVAAGGAESQREVANRLGVNESAVTAMANRLETMGFVERVRGDSDARAWRLRVTAAGHAALARAAGPFQKVNRRLDEALRDNDLERLTASLQRVAEAFGEPTCADVDTTPRPVGSAGRRSG